MRLAPPCCLVARSVSPIQAPASLPLSPCLPACLPASAATCRAHHATSLPTSTPAAPRQADGDADSRDDQDGCAGASAPRGRVPVGILSGYTCIRSVGQTHRECMGFQGRPPLGSERVPTLGQQGPGDGRRRPRPAARHRQSCMMAARARGGQAAEAGQTARWAAAAYPCCPVPNAAHNT